MNGKVRLAYLLALVFFCGFAMMDYDISAIWYMESSRRFVDLINKMGEALVIAATIGAVVDPYIKRELAKSAARDVLGSSLGYSLPQVVQDHLVRVLRLAVLRKDFELTIRLEPVDGYPGFVRATLVASYILWNISPQSESYVFKSRIERSEYPHVGENKLVSASIKRKRTTIYKGDLLRRRAKEDAQYLLFETHFSLGPDSSDVRCQTERSAVFLSDGHHVLDILTPTLGVIINVEPPEDYHWDVSCPESGEHILVSEVQRLRWKSEGMYLPGSMVRIRWKPKVADTIVPGNVENHSTVRGEHGDAN